MQSKIANLMHNIVLVGACHATKLWSLKHKHIGTVRAENERHDSRGNDWTVLVAWCVCGEHNYPTRHDTTKIATANLKLALQLFAGEDTRREPGWDHTKDM